MSKAHETYTAPCPCGNPDALWHTTHTATGTPALRITCGQCDPKHTPPAPPPPPEPESPGWSWLYRIGTNR